MSNDFKMAEMEESISYKRKASPEPTEEDSVGKRIRLDAGDNAPSNNDIRAELEDSPDGSVPGEEGRKYRNIEKTGAGTAKLIGCKAAVCDCGPPPARRNFSMEEKKRGQRLFGGLVSALSRPPSGAQQQKRLEIERRQQEKAQQRRADDEKRRTEKLERLKRIREIEQIGLDEQATKSEPKVHYLPWEPSKEQEDIIKDQIRAAEEMIDREMRDFKDRRERRFRELGVTPPPRSPTPPPQVETHQPELEPEPAAESRPDQATVGEPKSPPQETNPDTDAAAPTPSNTQNNHHEREPDENGDEVMQDEEDIVIY
ncbi:hypothetical protein N0V88_001989 [Collariella sp. IMI 366227]|nr:hypothetical protein N0V88_001989 [Collariella sp. IMI 366227]